MYVIYMERKMNILLFAQGAGIFRSGTDNKYTLCAGASISRCICRYMHVVAQSPNVIGHHRCRRSLLWCLEEWRPATAHCTQYNGMFCRALKSPGSAVYRVEVCSYNRRADVDDEPWWAEFIDGSRVRMGHHQHQSERRRRGDAPTIRRIDNYR